MLQNLPLELIDKILKHRIKYIEDIVEYKYINKQIYTLLNDKYYYQFILNEFMCRYKVLESRTTYYQNKVMRLDYVLNYESNDESSSYFDLDGLSDESDFSIGTLSP